MSATHYSPLLTDFYQLTMAYGYWKLGIHEQEATFHLLFRKAPFHANHALCCGLGSVLDFLAQWRFQEDDLDYLSTLKNTVGETLFPKDFLDYLKNLSFTCNMDAVPEGTIVFAHEPLVRIEGPIIQCQLIETALLNIINFQTLIATKASRVCRAAGKDPVVEFGMRRAQGPDGALSASRAAYIGGCVATSNTLAGKLYEVPVRGTHSHSWVSAFPNEAAAFSAYASVLPHQCILLVDTYNTIQGVKNAIQIGEKLRAEGVDLLGIRLDSGDMADLSIKARKLLDDAGFKNTTIFASNALDEYVISDLKRQQAKITAWGVGTHLATAYDHPALDGVYKLSSLRNQNGKWMYKLKLSEQEIKISNPGRHQIRRFFSNNHYLSDIIYDLDLGIPPDVPEAILLENPLQLKRMDDYDGSVDLLKPILKQGQCVDKEHSIHQIRKQAMEASGHFMNTHGEGPYLVAIEKNLYQLKQKLIQQINMSPSAGSENE